LYLKIEFLKILLNSNSTAKQSSTH